MFTYFHLFESYDIPFPDRKILMYLLEKYAATRTGSWLLSLNFHALSYKYCYAMDNGIMGAFCALDPQTIYIMPPHGEHDGISPEESFAEPVNRRILQQHPELLANWPTLIATTVIHELRHKYQRRRLGAVLYTLLALPGIREFTIEADARKVQRQCEPYIDQLAQHLMQVDFFNLKHQKKEPINA